jgi:hypothetical protein
VATAVVLIALVFWGGVFVVFFTAKGISPGEFFFGRYEPLPDDLGRWKETGTDEPSGLLREERLLLPDTQLGARHLVHQVRYRHPETRVITSAEPERRVRRRRVSAR